MIRWNRVILRKYKIIKTIENNYGMDERVERKKKSGSEPI